MIFVISGPSGCGKSTLINMVMTELPGLVFSVSHTSRPPRPGEENGIQYRFVSGPSFRKMIKAGRFLEWAVVHGNYYGTSKAEIKRSGKGADLILDIDVQGARQARRKIKSAIFVFIMPPAASELRKRLVRRGQDRPAVIDRRLKDSAAEVREYDKFDFVIFNDDLKLAASELKSLIVACRCRMDNQRHQARLVVESFKSGGGKHGS